MFIPLKQLLYKNFFGNRHLNKKVNGIAHNLWKYIRVLQQETKRQKAKLEDYLGGASTPNQSAATKKIQDVFFINHNGNISGTGSRR